MKTQELKHAAKLQEWAERIKECRSSGTSVSTWCQEQGISSKTYYRWERMYLAEATKALTVTSNKDAQLVKLDSEHIAGRKRAVSVSSIVIRHGDTTIELESDTAIDTIVELVSALNHYA